MAAYPTCHSACCAGHVGTAQSLSVASAIGLTWPWFLVHHTAVTVARVMGMAPRKGLSLDTSLMACRVDAQAHA